MPHFVDVLDFVTQLDGFLQFGGALRASEAAFVIRVCALVGSLQGGGCPFRFARRWRRRER